MRAWCLLLAVLVEISFASRKDEQVCGIGWRSYEGSCYTIQVASKTWDKSRADCISRDSELIKLTNLDELDYVYNTFIQPLHGQSAWIGLAKTDDGFHWQDGSNLSFTNWNYGEPNNFNGKEKCVELFVTSGKWNDIECTKLHPSICKKGTVAIHPDTLVVASLSNVDFALGGHVIQRLSNLDVMECSTRCFSDDNCFSINYEYTKYGNNSCELNNSTKALARPASFIKRPGSIYYD